MANEGPLIARTSETYQYYNENYPNIQRIREQNAQVSDTVRSKNEVNLVYDAVGESLKSGDKVLDCPCGLGFQADELAKRGLNVTAIDGSEDNVNFARNRAREGNVDFKQGLFSDLSSLVDHDSQDVVCCFRESFGYEPTVEGNVAHMQSMFDSLKQGGKLVLTWDFTPDMYRDGRKKDEVGVRREKKGTDEQGREIKYYSTSVPTELSDQVVPDEYIPERGFLQLKGNSPEAVENRTVRSYGKSQLVYVDAEGNEQPAPSFELREYFKPVIKKKASLIRRFFSIARRKEYHSDGYAQLGDSGESYDIPLVRAFCEHVGFEDVKCVPARKLDDGRWTVGIVATKPSLKNLDAQVASTRGKVSSTLEQ